MSEGEALVIFLCSVFAVGHASGAYWHMQHVESYGVALYALVSNDERRNFSKYLLSHPC